MFLNSRKLSRIYTSGLSISQIATQEHVSIHKVVYWMDKYGILRRSHKEATYLNRNPNGNPFTISKIQSQEEFELLSLGIALFMGEGDKRSFYSVRLANSDPRIIKLFIHFLKRICGVKNEKIRASLNIFDDVIYNESLNFWSEETGIPKENFYAPIIRPRKTGTYRNKSKYGTLTILVSNTKLLAQIKDWCNDFFHKYS